MSTQTPTTTVQHEILSLADYERKMKKFETCGDLSILPDMYVVVRIDAHRIIPQRWKDFPDNDYPLSTPFVDALIATARFVMCCEQKMTCCFIHGDEISFVLDTRDRGSDKRKSKIISLIASIAGTAFFNAFNRPVAFDAKLSELPSRTHVLDYLLWQRKVAQRNFLSRNIGILLSESGVEKEKITALINEGTEAMHAKMISIGHNPESYPKEVRFGAFLYWDPAHEDNLIETKDLSFSDEAYLAFLTSVIDLPARRITYGPQFVNITPLEKPEIGGVTPTPRKVTFRSKAPTPGASTRRFKLS